MFQNHSKNYAKTQMGISNQIIRPIRRTRLKMKGENYSPRQIYCVDIINARNQNVSIIGFY